MKELPEAIKKALAEIEKSHPKKYIALKKINGRYYAYLQSSKWNKAKQRPRVSSTYLGKITPEGAFIQKMKAGDAELKNAEAVIAAHGGQVVYSENTIARNTSPEPAVTEVDEKVLMALSMNGRATYSNIGRHLGMTAAGVYKKIKNLEARFGINYTLEIDTEKLGYTKYIVLVRFKKDKPAEAALKEVLNKEPRLQLAMLTSGRYDAILYFLSEDSRTLSSNIGDIRASPALKSLVSRWYVTPVYEVYGFIPLRNEFFALLEQRVWKRTKDRPRPASGEIMKGEYFVIKELNLNGSLDFTAIDRKYGLPRGSSRFAYYRLRERKVIKRATITMKNLSAKYNAVMLMNLLRESSFLESRHRLMSYIIGDKNSLTNHFSFVCDVETPDGILFAFPVFSDADFESYRRELLGNVGGITVDPIFVTNTLIGQLCYRKFDNRHSNQQQQLEQKYNAEPLLKEIDYDSL